MKYLLLVLLGFVLGAFAYHHFALLYPQRISPAATAVEASAAGPVSTASPSVPATATTGRNAPTPVADIAQTPGATIPQPITSAASAANPELPASVAADGLLLPVQGVTRGQLHDTFTDARSHGRSHDAIDIMAPAGTPVLAVADGHIEKLFDSERGGLTIYQFEPSGRLAYYYAHLQRYADGIAQGQAVRRGQVLGYVGSTGNANPAAPHLHFAIFVLGPERYWWQGQAINPYPVLMGDSAP